MRIVSSFPNAELRGLKTQLLQAVRNRKTKPIMDIYNRSKHGFVVLHQDSPPKVFLIGKAYGSKQGSCWVECIPFQPNEGTVRLLIENTKSIAQVMRC